MTYLKLVLSGLALALLWSATALYGGLQGWWLSPPVPPGDVEAFERFAREQIDAATPGAVAFVLVEDGEVTHRHFRSESGDLGPDTLFPTASFSKWPTAYGVMLLAQQGAIDLDAPVHDYLERWQLPESAFALDGVTPRRLLSHTAGLTDGLGFGDYSEEETVPAVEDSLASPRASGDAAVRIAVGVEPGSEWIYSGGSYLLLELLVEEVSGQPFADYMQAEVFAPLGMTRSGYAFLGDEQDVSGSFDREGRPAPLYRYAAKGATALAASANDLERFALAHLDGDGPLRGDGVRALRAPLGELFGAPIWGAGNMLYAPTGSGDFLFGHDGSNDPSINSTVRINPDSGDAIIVLSTGPAFLASELGYQWGLWQTGVPDFLQTGRAIGSALAPLALGAGLILLCTVVLVVRVRRQRRS